MIDLESKSKKYRILQGSVGNLYIRRNGTTWLVNPPASKMIIELACEIEELREKLAQLPTAR